MSSFIDTSASSRDPPGEYSLPEDVYCLYQQQSPSLEGSCLTFNDSSSHAVAPGMIDTSTSTIENNDSNIYYESSFARTLPASPSPLPTESEQVADMGNAIMRQDMTALVTMLVSNGYDPNSRMAGSGTTALHICARLDHTVPTMASLLVEYGADVNRSNAHGETPLMIAAMYQRRTIVEYLLRPNVGADVSIRAKSGDTALVYATAKRQNQSGSNAANGAAIVEALMRAEDRHAQREQQRSQRQLYDRMNGDYWMI
jgi:ankyrin repeat protein